MKGAVFNQNTLIVTRYLELLQGELSDFVEDLRLPQLWNKWSQYDGVSAHKTPPWKRYLSKEFGEQFSILEVSKSGIHVYLTFSYLIWLQWPFFSEVASNSRYMWSLRQNYSTYNNVITDACAEMSHAVIQHEQREIFRIIQMCVAADEEKFEHIK